MGRMKPLEIFKPGTWTALGGQRLAFTEADLAKTAAAYDPKLHEAPLVVGHPTTDGPAYGWVSGVAVADGALVAEPHQVDPAFAELVGAGRFKKRSAAFYPPGHPENPAPNKDVFYLRHVGFLGAQPPAVKGLRPVQFADAAADGLLTVEFGEGDDTPGWLSRLLDRLEARLEALFTAGRAPDSQAKPGDPAATEETPEMPDKNHPKDAALAERERQLAEREAALAAREKAAANGELSAFAEKAIAAGKLLPGEKEGFLAVAALLSTGEATLTFGEGTGAAKVHARGWLERFVEALPKRVEFGEVSADPGGDDALDTDFVAPPGTSVDQKQLALHKRALAYAEKHAVPYTTAVSAVSKETTR